MYLTVSLGGLASLELLVGCGVVLVSITPPAFSSGASCFSDWISFALSNISGILSFSCESIKVVALVFNVGSNLSKNLALTPLPGNMSLNISWTANFIKGCGTLPVGSNLIELLITGQLASNNASWAAILFSGVAFYIFNKKGC